jgi:hypothetical protein
MMVSFKLFLKKESEIHLVMIELLRVFP